MGAGEDIVMKSQWLVKLDRFYEPPTRYLGIVLGKMIEHSATIPQSIQRWHRNLAIAATALGVLLVTLAGSWAEARWPYAAGEYITVKPRSSADSADILWQLQRTEGVRAATGVFRTSLSQDDIEATGWRNAWLYTNQTEASWLAFLPPDPTLGLLRGRLPDVHSLHEAVLGYELAAVLRLGIGDTVPIQGRPFTVVGIWKPSTRLSGNFAQVSSVAAQALTPSSPQSPHYFVVLPLSEESAEATAMRIWRKIPDVEVVSPAWELSRAEHERTIQILSFGAAALLAVLLATPLLADSSLQRKASPLRLAVLSGIAGLAVGWGVVVGANLYAQRTLGLTTFALTPRLAIAILFLAAGLGLLASWLRAVMTWGVRYVATVLVLGSSVALLVTVGTLNESLTFALGEAQRTAVDWVTVPGVEADAAFLRDVERLPGIRGHTIEAYGGLANEDEDRWVGPWAPSGLFYGMQFVDGQGTLSRPHPLSYWRGGPLDPEKPDQAVIGFDLAQELGLEVGDTIPVRGVPFTVAGILNPLRYDPGSDANYRIDISLQALQRVLRDPFASGEITLLVPPARSQQEKSIFLSEVGNRLNVGGVWTVEDRLAEIVSSYPAAWTLSQADAQESVRHARSMYVGLVIICTVLLLAASALAVGGTMSDRLVRDELRVGLLKALGSDEGMLLGDYLQMAAVLGVAGALPGVLGGWAAATVLNDLAPARTAELLFTPRLGAGMLFAVVVAAMFAAVAPVSRAVRQDGTWPLYYSSLTRPEGPSSAQLGTSSPAMGKATPGGLG